MELKRQRKQENLRLPGALNTVRVVFVQSPLDLKDQKGSELTSLYYMKKKIQNKITCILKERYLS